MADVSIAITHQDENESRIERPLIVDLDGTLIRTDLLIESFLSLLARQPSKAIITLGAIRSGRAAFKATIADQAVIEFATLPFNEDVLDFIKAEKDKGRLIYLASASDRRYVEAVADHVGLFDGVFGSDRGTNLAGERKAEVLCAAFGEKCFDYVGDTSVDEAIWRRSHGVFLANGASGHLQRIHRWAPHAVEIGARRSLFKHRSWLDYVRAIRLHQWLKNTIILLPTLAAHQFGMPLVHTMLAFFSFSLCASSVYILNDLLDLRSDRAHARKKLRPFAAGNIPLTLGAALFPLLLALSLAVALFLPVKFLLVLIGYYALTCAYSFVLKRKTLVDVVALACLYGTRLLAGSAASTIGLSPWLAALAVFLFFCLALVKRCAELEDRRSKGGGSVAGRAYTTDDLPILMTMSAASGFTSVLVLSLYLNSDAVRALYHHPNRLWLITVLLLYWVSRTILLTHRGQMHDDPVVFAAKDRKSLAIAAGCVVIMAVSI